jgi:hypothetical protein
MAQRRALQDCEAAVSEYDADLGARQAELDAALAAHAQLTDNIQVCLQNWGGCAPHLPTLVP